MQIPKALVAGRFAGPLRCTGFTADEGGLVTELTAEYVSDLEGKKLKVRELVAGQLAQALWSLGLRLSCFI
jgi:hypothetical protein